MSSENNGSPSKKPGGRPKGSRNKVSLSAKENVLAVFTRLGGTAGMAKWAKDNQTDFYRLYAKLVPQAVDVDANITGNITVEVCRFASPDTSE